MSFFLAFIHRQFIYTPPAPTASFKGKTAIVTGASSGLGKEACRWMVRLGASHVILACRNIEKGKAAAQDIEATTSCPSGTLDVWHLDLSSYKSVQAFGDKVKAELPRLDVLIANAGIGTRKWGVTEDNEETITTNVVSLFLLAFLVYPKLRETAAQYHIQTHFTITASELYEVAKFKERKAPAGQLFATLSDKSKSSMSDRYNVSKLLEVFMVKQMASMSPLGSKNVIINCVAPGLCDTELARDYSGAAVDLAKKILCRPSEVGARTLVYGASAGPESHGQYVPDCKIKPTGGLTKGEAGEKLQKRVWVELRDKLEGILPGVTTMS
ncbi:retinol dehydrogenase [Rhizodiscina lignyota]|uniref:Retinol dehydrogenase n=1 Tax=Rhizodiscina lignyota TaxID=1504668 RepID=A0A9P4I757_9PEZI|nr:retinol dehydrogenase [Rhizodiscina lignyota]